MQSFYGGPAGQSFEIKKIFESYYGPDGAQVDLDKGWASPISVGEFVMVSYGLPSDATYMTRMNYDLNAGNKQNLNSTLWQKVYDESAGEGSGLSYKLISSCTGNTPKISITKPAIVLHANEQPDVETDLSNQDMPVIQFKLPRAQVLSMPQEATVLDADEKPSVEYNDDDIDHPTLHFNIPQSQVIETVELTPIAVEENPKVELDTTDINRPVLKFQLPVAQKLLDSNVLHKVLNANEAPTVALSYAEDDALNRYPILTFSLPKSWDVKVNPAVTKIDNPLGNPAIASVEDNETSTKTWTFSLPRNVEFHVVEDLSEMAIPGDYYILKSNGSLYGYINGSWTELVCFVPPISNEVQLTTIKPYTADGNINNPSAGIAKNDNGEWEFELELPSAPKIAASYDFVGSTESGEATAAITSEDTVTFSFKIPTGSKLFAGLEVTTDGATVTIDGARIGDVYLNSDTGILYTLTANGWKASEKNIKGPVGDALNIEAEYQLTQTESYDASLENGVSYIEEHYTGTIDSHKIFAVTWTLLDNGGDVSYWYFKTNAGEWARAQLTGGVSSLIENTYKENIDNKTYSINYINSLIGGDETNTDRTAYSKDQVQSLVSWGSFQDLIDEP